MEPITTKIICPDCYRVHLKDEICICKKMAEVEYKDPNPFDR